MVKKDSLAQSSVTEELSRTREQLNRLATASSSASSVDTQAITATIANLIQETHNAQATQAVLYSLKFEQMNDRYYAIRDRHEKTFEWLFESPDVLYQAKGLRVNFSQWLTTDGRIFWISGKAGSGKSTMMKFLATIPGLAP